VGPLYSKDQRKILLVISDEHGRNVIGTQHLRKKHKRFENKLGDQEPALQQMQEAGTLLIDSIHLGHKEI